MSDPCEKCGYDWLEGDAMCRTIDELKALALRAADALERWTGNTHGEDKLIAELRKAAQ
jgi:hypothetical protein